MKIEFYDFGKIIVDGKVYGRDLIIFPEKILEPRWREEGHSLSLADLKEVIEFKPEILIIGTGYSGLVEVPRGLIKELGRKRIRVLSLRTQEACKEFNRLTREGKRAVAALHLTC
jgi:hypothetical protein